MPLILRYDIESIYVKTTLMGGVKQVKSVLYVIFSTVKKCRILSNIVYCYVISKIITLLRLVAYNLGSLHFGFW